MADLERVLTVRNKLGLHLRAAAQLVQTANRFRARVLIRRDHATVDAKSIMGVMSLGAASGTELSFLADGDDAVGALDAMERLFSDRFGETE